MSEVVLHDFWRSTAAYRVRIALNLKGIAYRSVPVDLSQGENLRDDYYSLNPQGLVPTLQIDGHILTQSLAIIDYLDATHKHPPMVSSDPLRRSRTLAQALTIAADIHPVNNLRVLNALRSDFGASEEQVRLWVQRWIAAGFAGGDRARSRAVRRRNPLSRRCLPGRADVQRAPLRARSCRVPQAGADRRRGARARPRGPRRARGGRPALIGVT